MGGKCILCFVLATLGVSVQIQASPPYSYPKPDSEDWQSIGHGELMEALELQLNNKLAKNVVLFIGDGMGISTLTAARINQGQMKGSSGEEGKLTFEKFPHMGLSKTYNTNSQVGDSAGTATAILTGEKVNIYTIGVNSGVETYNCFKAADSILTNIADLAQRANIATGFVTNSRITHATPASLYAHTPNRFWESKVDPHCPHYEDIGLQFIKDKTAKNFKVAFAGGRAPMGAPRNITIVKDSIRRKDSRNLTKEWIEDRRKRNIRAMYLETKSQLLNTDFTHIDHILGLFSDDHMAYTSDGIPEDEPTLTEMVEVAVRHLSKNGQRFFLFVEGAKIDLALHLNLAGKALREVSSFDDAVKRILHLVNTDETLIVVTADHSHSLTINGYPKRGHSILGHGDLDNSSVPYSTLMFATGPGYNGKFEVTEGRIVRKNMSEDEVMKPDFEKLAPVIGPWGDATHGGEDVAIYAKGPKAHLFHSLHEQNYIFHAMAYAMCIHPTMACAAASSLVPLTGIITIGLIKTLLC